MGDAAAQTESKYVGEEKMRPFIHQLLVSRIAEYFLSELKEVAFCVWMLDQENVSPSLTQFRESGSVYPGSRLLWH
jgi:hypothetical protein